MQVTGTGKSRGDKELQQRANKIPSGDNQSRVLRARIFIGVQNYMKIKISREKRAGALR